MTNVSKNSLDLIETTGKKLKGKLGKAFLATLILVAPIMACIFSFYLIPVAVLLFGVLQTGYIRYIRDLIDDKQPSLKIIFSEFSNPGVEILLGTILICMFALGTILVILPAIILIALYSMSFYFAENKKSNSPLDAMKHSRVHMRGNYTNMFSFKVLYWLVYVLLIVFGLAGVIISFKLWANYKVLSIVVFAVDFIFTTLLWSLTSTYYNTSCELFFRELLVYNGEVKEEKQVEIIEEPVELKTEEEKVVKAPVKRTSTAKTSTKKSTATKSTSTKATPKTAPKTTKTTTSKTTKTTKSATTKKTSSK